MTSRLKKISFAGGITVDNMSNISIKNGSTNLIAFDNSNNLASCKLKDYVDSNSGGGGGGESNILTMAYSDQLTANMVGVVGSQSINVNVTENDLLNGFLHFPDQGGSFNITANIILPDASTIISNNNMQVGQYFRLVFFVTDPNTACRFDSSNFASLNYVKDLGSTTYMNLNSSGYPLLKTFSFYCVSATQLYICTESKAA